QPADAQPAARRRHRAGGRLRRRLRRALPARHLAGHGRRSTLISTMANSWVFWALLSALFAGATAVLAKVGVAGVDSNLATAIRTTVVLVFAWAIALACAQPGAIAGLSRRTWLMLALSGLATGLSWLCYFRALQLGPASQVAPIDKLSVV